MNNVDTISSVDAVSVVMTDAEQPYVRRMLLSVIDQEPLSRVIVVYNNQLLWMKPLIEEFNARVDFIGHHKVWASIARNLGVAASSAEYIAFVDGDDFWRPNKISVQIEVMMNEKADLVGCDHVLVDTNHKAFAFGICKNIGMTSGWLVRRELISENPFDETLSKDEDAEWWVRCFYNYKLIRLPNVFVEYTVRGGSLSSSCASKRRKEKLKQFAGSFLTRGFTLAASWLLRKFHLSCTYNSHPSWARD